MNKIQVIAKLKMIFKTEIEKDEENKHWKVGNIMKSASENVISDKLKFGKYLHGFAIRQSKVKCR